MGHDAVTDRQRKLAPGDILGILGGGQLGRMIALAAARLGLRTHIYCPDPASPAFDVTPNRTIAAYDDASALAAFADAVDAVTFEFENVPARTAEILEACTVLRPNARALAVSQDRLLEKTFFRDRAIPTAPYAAVDDEQSLAEALRMIGTPSILKTRTLGYDGKGQRRLDDAGDASQAWSELAGAPAILEGFVPFAREVSLVMARGLDGDIAFYDMAENRHENHILRQSLVPAALPDATVAEAREIGRRTLTDLDYVGVLAVELFVVERGAACDLVVNEIAPRVHNSGHWTEAVCPVSQFEQHVRAVCGWPLGSTSSQHDVDMRNLLGTEAETWQTLAREPGTVMHLYGKAEARPGRKMGHITRILGPRSS